MTETSDWRTGISYVTPADVIIRGYPLQELIASLDFGGLVYLLLRGELPTPGQSKMINAQAGSDEGHGVIVAAELSNEALDMGHLPEMVEEVGELREELGKEAKEVTAISTDRGYFSVENIQQEGKGIELLKRGSTISKKSDSWECPDGRLLERERNQSTKGRPKLRRYFCTDCNGSSLRAYCLKPGEERRLLLVKRKQLIRADMRARLKDPVKQAIVSVSGWPNKS